MQKLFTIGYEGASVEELVETLLNVGIKVLADVRELPLSRKKGLSKNGLAAHLAEAGIEYRHYRQRFCRKVFTSVTKLTFPLRLRC